MPSLLEDIAGQSVGEESDAVSLAFDTKNFQRLKMISEVPPSLIYTMTTLGLMQKRYKSKVLKDFITEFLSIQKSRDRQGITELVEILLGVRRMSSEED